MDAWKLAVPVLASLAVVMALAIEPVLPPPELSGAEMYRVYCASCHGLDGRGNGPATPALKKRVPDLTQISRRNGGAFPAFRITHIIDGYEIQAYHGSHDMPIWGDYFLSKKRDDAIVTLREHNLTEFLRSIQK